jgi:ABC-2 type transport system ATP-binding protein
VIDTPVVVKDVTKRFRSAVAVDAVSWAPGPGRVTALVGLNGAGKSTLMRMMAGLIKPTSGTVTTRRPLAAMIEAPALFGGLSARRNLRIHCILTGAPPARIGEVAELTRIAGVLDQRAGTLSQGYRQRLAIAIALLGSPAALLLDEPANALDPEAIAHLREILRIVADQGTAVVVSSHQLRELEGTADALTLLHDGRIRYDGAFGAFVGPTALRVRAAESAGTGKLAELLRHDGVAARDRDDHLWIVPGDGDPDRAAARIATVAAGADITLLELSHVAPTLEEAFHTAVAGARS